MTKYFSYRLSRLLAAFSVCVYALMAVLAMRPDGLETFRFFNWSLFSESSNVRFDVVVRVHSVDGQNFPAPRLYYDMGETFAHARRGDPNLFKIADRLHVAVRTDDQASIISLRELIERRYMAEVGAATYDVALLIYDPIERLNTGAVERVFVLATYEK